LIGLKVNLLNKVIDVRAEKTVKELDQVIGFIKHWPFIAIGELSKSHTVDTRVFVELS